MLKHRRWRKKMKEKRKAGLPKSKE